LESHLIRMFSSRGQMVVTAKEFPPRGKVQLFQLDKPATFTCSLRNVDVSS